MAELVFDQWALESGIPVSRPVNSDEPWDRMIWYGKKWQRVQVKRVFAGRGNARLVNMKRYRDKRYKRTDAEYLAAVDVDTHTIWLVPWRLVCTVKRKTIGKKLERYKV